jgi:hypothetical protein
MHSPTKCRGAAAVVMGLLLGLASSADAQIKIAPSPQRIFPADPNPLIAPGVRLQQWAYNTLAIGKVYAQLPPYLLGFNQTPGGGVYNPATVGPGFYAPYGYSSGGINPLTGSAYTSGGYSSYGSGGYYGSDLSSSSQLGLSQEQARILREQALQAKLDTRKKLVDTLAYIRANQYGFSQEQADIAKRLLERVQVTPTPTEIASGKSLNILLRDLAKFSPKQLSARTFTLDEDILKLLNVTGGHGSLALLRNDGQIPWPAVFADTKVLPTKMREDMDSYAKLLYYQAANNANGKVDPNVLQNLELAAGKLRENLKKNINNVGGSANYLEGTRFLDDLDAAILALRRGDAGLVLDFNQRFAKGGKTVQELVEYMAKNGLTIAPAMPGDERAYQALQTALAAQSVALHAEVAAAKY